MVDDFNREASCIAIDTSLPAARVIRELDQLIAWRGKPERLRMDNGPKSIAQAMQEWAASRGFAFTCIQPGMRMQSGLIERFNKTYRTEVLNAWIFERLDHVRSITHGWKWGYNNQCPHRSLLRLSPRAFLLRSGQFPAHFTGSRAEFPIVQHDIHITTTLKSTFTNRCAKNGGAQGAEVNALRYRIMYRIILHLPLEPEPANTFPVYYLHHLAQPRIEQRIANTAQGVVLEDFREGSLGERNSTYRTQVIHVGLCESVYRQGRLCDHAKAVGFRVVD